MPGHVKKGKPGEADPDPTPYLVVTLEMKREFQQKPYDTKKSYWCPDGKGGYAECMLEEDDGTKAKVIVGGFEVIYIFFTELFHIVYYFKSTLILQMATFLAFYRKKSLSLKRLVKSILLSLRCAKTWLT